MPRTARKSTVAAQNRIGFRTLEGFDKKSWADEGERHLLSAKALRQIRKRRRSALRKSSEESRLAHFREMDAAVHSSTLLLGYAVELFLKAGLTRLYVGCSKELFERDVKRRYSHDLAKLAKAIEYPNLTKVRSQLTKLNKVIVSEGRYPFVSADANKHMSLRNDRAVRFWSDDEFNRQLKLASSIRKHIGTIDDDTDNPCVYQSFKIDDDGYFAFRCGGNLRSRITVRYSGMQRFNKRNNKRYLKTLILRHSNNNLIKSYWDTAIYRVVKI